MSKSNHNIKDENLKKVSLEQDLEIYQTLVNDLEFELKQKNSQNEILETDITALKRKLINKEEQLAKQERELHKLRSVLQQTSLLSSSADMEKDRNVNYLQNHLIKSSKKQGVSGKSVDPENCSVRFSKTEKDVSSKLLIKEALMENEFLSNLSETQIQEIIDYMEIKYIQAGNYIITEGETGSHLYVSASGEYEVIKDNKHLSKFKAGKAFGELAILYNCQRTASIKASINGTLWALQRCVFQYIMMKTGMRKMEERIKFLKGIQLFSSMTNDQLLKLSDVCDVNEFTKGTFIVRQGVSGETFYIISQGSVRVTKTKTTDHEGKTDEDIRILQKGDYFGEQALLHNESRTANVIADSELVTCLSLDRESFLKLFGGELSELRQKVYQNDAKLENSGSQDIHVKDRKKQSLDNVDCANLRLEELKIVSTLGIGGFGRVELVRRGKDTSKTFALKCLKKQYVVEMQQQEHVFNERNIMLACRHQFITRLWKTFRDRKYVYFLMEANLGGELWTILRNMGHFDESTTKFYIACVINALDYLHHHGIIYRDLKPENLLLDKDGFIKMVDFGFAKHVRQGSKTWTFCGTPEYVAPEIILNRGHDRAVDFWSLGILISELLTGTPPFVSTDPMKIYHLILRGIEHIYYPPHVNKSSLNIIKKFCMENPAERLGYQRHGILDIKRNRWFQGFDWDGLVHRRIRVPMIPKIKSPDDATNFDRFQRDDQIAEDEFSGWDSNF